MQLIDEIMLKLDPFHYSSKSRSNHLGGAKGRIMKEENIGKEPLQLEALRKDEKEKAIKKSWKTSGHPAWLEISQIWNPAWLEEDFPLSEVEKEIEERFADIKHDIDVIIRLPELGFEAMEVYKRTLDLSTAIKEVERLSSTRKREKEARPTKEETEEVKRRAQQIEDPRYKVRIELNVTMTQATELRAWLDARQIEARQV